MPTVGDTRLGITLGATAIPTPSDGTTEVSVNLSEITYLLRVEEYLTSPSPGWYTGASQNIASVASMSLTESPNISQDSLTFQIGSPLAYTGTITIPVNSTLNGSTEYTWQVNLDITHGTITSGSVSRNYDTIQVSFTTEASAPLKAATPSPAHSATGVILLPTLSWIDGGGADTYNVYLGTPGNLVQIAEEQVGLSLIVPYALAYNVVYNWRVNSINVNGTTTGNTWAFTCLLFAPPFPTGVTLDYGEDPPAPTGTPTGVNNMATLKRIVAVANDKVFYET